MILYKKGCKTCKKPKLQAGGSTPERIVQGNKEITRTPYTDERGDVGFKITYRVMPSNNPRPRPQAPVTGGVRRPTIARKPLVEERVLTAPNAIRAPRPEAPIGDPVLAPIKPVTTQAPDMWNRLGVTPMLSLSKTRSNPMRGQSFNKTNDGISSLKRGAFSRQYESAAVSADSVLKNSMMSGSNLRQATKAANKVMSTDHNNQNVKYKVNWHNKDKRAFNDMFKDKGGRGSASGAYQIKSKE